MCTYNIHLWGEGQEFWWLAKWDDFRTFEVMLPFMNSFVNQRCKLSQD